MVSASSYYHGAMEWQLLISADRNNKLGHTHLLSLIAIFSRFMTYVIRLFTRYYEQRMLQRIIPSCSGDYTFLLFFAINQYRFCNEQISQIYNYRSHVKCYFSVDNILKTAKRPIISEL